MGWTKVCVSESKMAVVKWRARWRISAILFAVLLQIVNGYEEMYTISQLSPKSSADHLSPDLVLHSSRTENLAFSIEPSVKIEGVEDLEPEDILADEEKENHIIVERSADLNRESRSINVDEIPSSNNEIDNELEVYNKRKYYEIRPTRTIDYLRSNDDIIMSSDGFGDRLEFRFPGEAKRVPIARALPIPGPRIKPTAVQPIFATATYREQGRQNTEIQNIITGIVKLLNGNVNVQANSQLLNGRPGRPLASRINNRGPPRISDVPPLPEFEKVTPPAHAYHPTRTPPPYPFDRPPHQGVNLPEQIVPPLNHRPGIYRPMPPWQRPRPRPPMKRPNPGLPMYKPTLPLPLDLPEEDKRPEEEVTVNENENSENNIHHEDHVEQEPDHETQEDKITTVADTTTSTSTTTTEMTTSTEKSTTERTTTEKEKSTTTTEKLTTTTQKATTTEKPKTTTEKITEKPKPKTTTTEKATTTSSTTEKSKTEKPVKIDKEKKKDVLEKDKFIKDKYKIVENKTKNESITESPIESSILESKSTVSPSIAVPTPTEGLMSHAPVINVSATHSDIASSSINSQPLPSSQGIPYQPYRPRPGIVLDDTDFKPHGGSRYRPEASVITAAETRLPGYGEIFDVTLTAIQGEKGTGEKNIIHIGNLNPVGSEHDDIIVSASGEQGFVSIDGKRTYLNLFDTSATASIRPTKVQSLPQSAPPHTPPPLGPVLGTGVAIPTDDIPLPPPQRRPVHGPPQVHGPPPVHGPPQVHGPAAGHRPTSGYRRPQPTVRIDTCIVGDDSTCDQAQNEMCRTEAAKCVVPTPKAYDFCQAHHINGATGISSCQCRPGYARRLHRDPCRRVVALLLNLRVDRLYDRKVVWDAKLADKESDPYQQLSYEAVRAIDSAFSMTPFSDDFVSGSVNAIHPGDENHQEVFVNYTVLLQETPETQRPAIATDIQKHILGVIRRRSNNVGTSAVFVDTPAGSVLPLKDVDECASSDLNDCHQLAFCTNTWGGFKCACPDTTLDGMPHGRAGRECRACSPSHCNDRGECRYSNNHPYCSCSSGYYGSTCEVDGEVVGVAVGASLAAAVVIALTLAFLLSWSRKWSREQKAAGMGSPVFSYMAANTIKTPPVGQPPYQISLEERMRWAQIAEAMAQTNHYAQAEPAMATRPSSAMFGGYPTLPPVPMPSFQMLPMGSSVGSTRSQRICARQPACQAWMGIHGHHTGTLNTVASRANTAASHHNLYGYTNHMATESTSSEASSHVQERADLLVPRPKSRARSMHNQTGIYYDVEYENAPDGIYGTKGIPLSTYTVSRGPPFYRS